MTIWACQAGKDVYVEKPLTHDLSEGKKVIDAQNNHKRIVQVGTHASLVREPTGRRRPWAHYLAQPGILEVIGTYAEDPLATGFLAEVNPAQTLDLGAVSSRSLAAVQRSRPLDHPPPFRSRRTRLRWAASSGDPSLVLRLGDDGMRTVRLTTEDLDPRMLADFCADLARRPATSARAPTHASSVEGVTTTTVLRPRKRTLSASSASESGREPSAWIVASSSRILSSWRSE